MIIESFDGRTFANMEVALESACSVLTVGQQHEARRYIAYRIMECAERGERNREALIAAGRIAASELCTAGATPGWQGDVGHSEQKQRQGVGADGAQGPSV
jgi:hypothetical protein